MKELMRLVVGAIAWIFKEFKPLTIVLAIIYELIRANVIQNGTLALIYLLWS